MIYTIFLLAQFSVFVLGFVLYPSFTFPLSDVYNIPKEDLTLLLMGDTQYYYKCEPGNRACKRISKRCRENFGLDYYLRAPFTTNESVKAGQQECTKLESRYANRVQRQALDMFIAKMMYKPSALVLNGDLTDFGHLEQFKEFKRGWMRSFRIPILLGLGNHDYENNINDCAFNFCAHTMLTWLTSYAKNMSLELEYERSAKSPFEITYNGSFAYSTRVCSLTGTNCAHVIQLNNAVDYETEFSSFLVEWKIKSALNFLKKELRSLKDMNIPILINMHQCEGTRMEKLKQLIADWIYETRHFDHPKRVAVFYAHMHSMHEARTFCFHDTSVPFVYVGSVPNNRFSLLRITRNGTSLHGFASGDSFDVGEENSVEVLGSLEDMWKPCVNSNHSLMQFMGAQERSQFANILRSEEELNDL